MEWMTQTWLRLKALVQRQQLDRDLEEELRFHLAMREEKLAADGSGTEEARYAVRRRFGNITLIKEVAREMWTFASIEHFWQDVRYGARVLAKYRGVTTIAVLTLALGIGANTAIFSVVNGVLLRPLPFPQQERVVTLWEKEKDGSRDNTTFATFTDWKSTSKSFSGMALVGSWQPTLVLPTEAENLVGFRVSSSMFDLLGVRLALGRNFLPEEDVREKNFEVILSHGLWQRRFGSDPTIVGKSIALGSRSHTVVGVLPAGFPSVFSFDPRQPAEIYMPLGYDATLPWACRSCHHLRAVARLKDGVTLAQAGAEMNVISENLFKQYPQDYSGPGVIIIPFQDYLVGQVRPVLLVLLGAVGFVMLIACANVANLLLSRATQRRREVSIRAALGAGRLRLVRQFLTESILLSVMGGALGLLLAYWGMQFLLKFSPGNIPRLGDVRLDGWVLAFTMGISLLTGLIFGLAPALQASRAGIAESLKEGARGTEGRQHHRLRGLLVVADVALALVLLTGAGLMMKGFVRLLEVNRGFDDAKLLTMQISLWGANFQKDAAVLSFYKQALDRVAALPGVDSAGVVSQLPLGGNIDRYGIHAEGKSKPNPAEDPSADRYAVSPNYLRAMRIPLLRGRELTMDDRPESPMVVAVNDTLAKGIWLGEDPIGKRVKVGDPKDPWRTVVGVVGDVLHQGLDAPHTMQIYVPHPQWRSPDSDMILVVRSSKNPVSLAAAVRAEIAAVDSRQPVSNVSTMEDVISLSAAQRRFSVWLFALFATLGMVLAAVGLYGVISSVVSQRTNEIGIRMALGAGGGDVLRMVLGQGVRLALVGIAFGLAGSYGLTRLMRTLLFGVTPTDRATFTGVTLLLLAVALGACWIPARRASKVSPMIALRYE